jgi:LysM repeat protein
MKFWANPFTGVLLLAGGLALSGCLPSGDSAVDEEKEPHFLAGKSRASEMDFKGAMEAFEQALEVNPRSAAAHFELALLCEKKDTDPAAAIYHYEQYLKLRPGAENAEILVKPHILACKQELARTVSLGAVTERQQHDFELLAEENKRLHDELQQLRGRNATNAPVPPAPVAIRVLQGPGGAPVTLAAAPVTPTTIIRTSAKSDSSITASPARSLTASSAAARTHTVKSGETPTIIARKYNVKLDALMAVNPKLDARRMRVGQVVAVPAS